MGFPLWILGCLISLGGSVGAIFGTNVQKLSFRKNEARPAAERRVYYKQGLWLLGLLLVAVGGCTDFIALALAPQSTIAALGSIPLAANTFLAHYWLKEPLGRYDLVGTALIVVGSTLSVVFGDHSDTTYTAAELQDLYGHVLYVTYGCVIGCSLILMYCLCRWKLTPLRVELVEAIDALNTNLLEANIAEGIEQEADAEAHSQTSTAPTSAKASFDSSAQGVAHSVLGDGGPPLKRQLSTEEKLTAAAAGVSGDEVLAAEALSSPTALMSGRPPSRPPSRPKSRPSPAIPSPASGGLRASPKLAGPVPSPSSKAKFANKKVSNELKYPLLQQEEDSDSAMVNKGNVSYDATASTKLGASDDAEDSTDETDTSKADAAPGTGEAVHYPHADISVTGKELPHGFLDGDAPAETQAAIAYSKSLLSLQSVVVELESKYTSWSRVHPVFFCAISGIFGAQSLLFGKSVSSLLANTMSSDGENQFAQPLTYVFLVALGVCLVGQLHFFATALNFFDSLLVVPLFKCFFLTLSTLGGALYFQEFSEFDALQAGMFALGLGLNLLGVYVLSSRKQGGATSTHLDGEEEDEDEEVGEENDGLDTPMSVSAGGGGDRDSSTVRFSDATSSGVVSAAGSNADLESGQRGRKHAQLLAQASQRLLQSAVDIAETAAAARSHSNADHEFDADADAALMVVSSPMDGVVLIASPVQVLPPVDMYHTHPTHMGTHGPVVPDTPVVLTMPSILTSPEARTSMVVGSVRHGPGLASSESWVSPESARTLATGRAEPHPQSAMPYTYAHAQYQGSMFSPSSLAAGTPVEVNVFSLPSSTVGYAYRGRAVTSTSSMGASATSSAAGSHRPSHANSMSFTPAGVGNAGALRRTTSEAASSSTGAYPPPPASTSRARTVRDLHSRSVFARPPMPRRGTSFVGPRSGAGATRRKPSDILVQKGSTIYRASGPGADTPLDSSLPPAAASVGPGRAVSSASGLGDMSFLPVALTPGSSSSFTVQSPLTNQQYSMPRKDSIFAHTKRYLQLLSNTAGLNTPSDVVARGRLSSAGQSPSWPTSALGSASSASSASSGGPGARGYTAPTVRAPSPSYPSASTTAAAQQAFVNSEIGPSTFEAQRANVAHYAFPAQGEAATGGWSGDGQGPAQGAQLGIEAPAPSAASTYVPSPFLAQSLATPSSLQ